MNYKLSLPICLTMCLFLVFASLMVYADEADDHYNQGNVLFGAGKYQEAIVEYQKALELQPDHKKAQLMLAEAQARLDGIIFPEAVECLTTSNDYVEIATSEQGSGGGANFTMGTTGGDPDNPNDDNQKLIFSHPCSGTTFTTVRIDDNDYYYGSTQGTFITEPYIDGTVIECVWKISNVAITQRISIVTSTVTGNPDSAEIKYIIQNNDSQNHQIGLRVMLDTMLGTYDGAPIDIPNSPYVEYEREFNSSNMPQYWTAIAGTVEEPIFKAQGTLIGVAATMPDKFVTADWNYIVQTLWDYSASTSRYVTDDSSVGIWWNPVTIAPGNSRTIITYYGIGRVESSEDTLVLDLTIPALAAVVDGNYSPNPFQANLTVRTQGGVAAPGVTAQISLPNGLALSAGETATKNIGDIPAGGSGQATWDVCITGDVVDDVLTVSVSAESTDPYIGSSSVDRTIQIPPIVGTISATDSNGNAQSSFDLNENVYLTGTGFAKPSSCLTNNRYNAYVVPASISNGANLASADVSGSVESLATNANGNFGVSLVWSQADTEGDFLLVVDGNRNGVYDDSSELDATASITISSTRLKWRYQTGDDVYISSPAIGSDGTIYVGSSDNYLHAINPDGSPKWKYQTGYEVYSSPAIGSDGTIYVGSQDGYLHAVNPDGSPKWKYQTGSYVRSSPAIGSDGTIYVGSCDNYLHAVNPDGSPKWKYQTGFYVWSSPAIGSDGTIYVGSEDGYLHAVNPDGSPKWKYQTGYEVYSSPAIGSDGTIYVGSSDNYLHAINPDGSPKWKYQTGSYVRSSPAIGSDGTIYVGSCDNYLHAVNPDGSPKWKYQTGEHVYSSPAIGSDGTIYVGSCDNYLHAVNPDGSPKWKYQTGDHVWSSPAIGSDGAIYVGSYDNYLYALQSDSLGLADGPWPKFHHDNQNTGRVPQTLPDFVAVSISLEPPNPTTYDEITFTAVVQNAGPGDAGASEAILQIGGETSPPVENVPALGAGESYTFSREAGPFTHPTWTYGVTLTVDSSDAYEETNEDNNEKEITFTPIDCLKGDIDGNSLVLINDAVLLLKHIADPEGNPFDARQTCAADMDDNGVILINDAVLLLKKIAGGAPGITSSHYSDTEAKLIISESKAKQGSAVKLTASSKIAGVSINLEYQNARLIDVKTFGLSAIHQDGNVIKIAWLNDGNGKIAELEFEGKPILNAEDIYVSDSSGNLISADIIHNPIIDNNLLMQNYPNPFNPETWIPFQLKELSDVTIGIYNQKGHLIKHISLGKKEAGIYIKKDDAAYWDGCNDKGERVAGGMYFYTITAGQFKATRKMIMLK